MLPQWHCFENDRPKVLAHPSSMTCNYNCMAQYTPGSTFGLMYGVPTIGGVGGVGWVGWVGWVLKFSSFGVLHQACL